MADIPDAELEQLRNEAAAGKTAAEALDKSQQDLEAARAQGVTALTDALRSANADLPADAIAGATIDEVNASVARARSIAEHVKSAAPAPAPAATQPTTAGQASAPARTEPTAPEGLRGTERIRAALNAKKE